MFINLKRLISGLAMLSVVSLGACATKAPRIGNAALGYAVTAHTIDADAHETAFSDALGQALGSAGKAPASAMVAKANVTIDVIRYDSPVIGLFYGGRHHSSLSVVLVDGSGKAVSRFPLFVAVNGDRDSADADLAAEAANIIAAKAANAFMPIRMQGKAAPKPAEKPATKTADIAADPCVIGPDGKCIVF